MMLLVQANASALPFADGSAQCVVTSPPYWGLRDYGTARWDGGDPACDHMREVGVQRYFNGQGYVGERGGAPSARRNEVAYSHVCGKCGATRIDAQLGLEPTPDAYVQNMVQVFREVARVLRDDGVCWIVIGDSYAAGKAGRTDYGTGDPTSTLGPSRNGLPGNTRPGPVIQRSAPVGLKPKDLVGIPWSVAKALQAPYYTGSIRDERDRVWLAAMLDAEGCMFIHKRKAGQSNGQGYYRQNDNYGPGVEISNTSLALVERIAALVGKGSICSQGPDENARRKQTLYRWNLRTTESRDFVRELYPYLVAKQQQARILCGCPASGERAEAAHAALMALHRTGASSVDFPAPASMLTPGWYLRSDVIWSKCNPMPESVTDRPTKSHEYVFLLTKSERYFWDADAVKEPMVPGVSPPGNRKIYDAGRPDGMTMRGNRAAEHLAQTGRNIRSVWHIATQPYPGAHFATMPEALVSRCIRSASRPGDVVLDPFLGSGTVARVALRLGRKALGCDLNPTYLTLADDRTRVTYGLPFGVDRDADDPIEAVM